jgi:hypothetical protein
MPSTWACTVTTPTSIVSRPSRQGTDEQVWTEESLEVFLDGNLDRRSYVQIITSAIGSIFDASHENGLGIQDLAYSPTVC